VSDTYAAYPSQLNDSTRPVHSLNLRNHFGALKISIFLNFTIYRTHLPKPVRRRPFLDLFENRLTPWVLCSPREALRQPRCLPRSGKYAATRTHKRRSRDAIFSTATSRTLRRGRGVDGQIERDNLKIPERKARRTVKQNPR
jgi:hypothetical protein